MNRGLPPTDLKALTGESTPPGRSSSARLNRFSELDVFIKILHSYK